MATQLFFDHLLSTEKMADINSEQSVETEILLADYDEPVFKIVKTTMEHLVTQKYIMQNKLTVEGFIKVSVYYQPPKAEKISVITQKVPFQKQLDLPSADYDLNFITIGGQCQYVNTRPQNSTRIDVRGAYMFAIKVFSQQKVNTVTAISGTGVCCDSSEISHFCLAGQNIRQFNTENELLFTDTPDRILRVQTRSQTPTVAVYQDKITVKGEINADIFYTAADSAQVKKHTQAFAYNQIIDMKGIKENYICCADISVCSFGISQNQDSKKYTASVTVQIDATAFSRQQVISVNDAFSRRFEYTKTRQEMLCDTNMYHIDKNIAVQINETLPDNSSVRDIIVEVTPLKSYYEINKTTVKAKVTANIIAVNGQNEYECIQRTEDVVLDWLENCGQYDEICLKIIPDNCTYTHSGSNIQINTALAVQGFVIEKRPFSLLKAFEEDENTPVADAEEALVIYYAQKGERVFEIAKNHNADPRDIMEENSLQSGVLQADQMLFIPAFAQ